ncbi:DNA glycosylase [Cylindrobasidium torrendii FP15055 ss-10]|uniref:DNA glycosylase n=1 Tax=Cylindrobasidium torrendii FP15055 ss-10 TaxID=1314674 RepID=A0A0D7BCQ9_9AGAR|nr:DNA glycosylase [Cylindrobasidium torrendii FP15055 ss-10]
MSLKRSLSPVLETAHASKKLKLLSDYSTISPFPDFARPTAEEALEVHSILSKHHPDTKSSRPTKPRDSDNSARTCGQTFNVVDSLIGTILSQNTSGKNSTRAKASLDRVFGRHNFAAIVDAPLDAVIDAIRSGGLANKKAATIQSLLRSIHEKHGSYSLQHLSASDAAGPSVTDDEIMRELCSYKGVGPKTASCVLLFCIGRDSFAVDTHVFRLSKSLGWVPPSADRVLAQAHLDLRIPPELKYGLHILMVRHGRTCKPCSGKTSTEECPLKAYIKTRKV